MNYFEKAASLQRDLLKALLRAPDKRATIDDATKDLDHRHDCGGKWRGAAVLALSLDGLISADAATHSRRPSRHSSLLTVWRIEDERAATKRVRLLDRVLTAISTGPRQLSLFNEENPPAATDGFDDSSHNPNTKGNDNGKA